MRTHILPCAPRSIALAALTVLTFAAPQPLRGQAAERRPGELLIRFRPGTSVSERIAVSIGQGLVLGPFEPYARVHVARFSESEAPEARVARLLADPRVEHAQPNFVYHAFQVLPQDPAIVPGHAHHQYGFALTRLPSLWRSSADGGAGKVIAIVDTGVDAGHGQLAGRVLAGFDFVNNDADPADDDGHGTHVAGIAAAAADGVEVVGTAFAASILPVKVLDATGTGTTANVAAGIAYAAANGANVVNLSLGLGVTDPVVRDAVADAYAAGCVLVAASGNGGGSALAFPAGYEEVIAVGAVNAAGAVPSFSQYGRDLDVVAPGDAIWSLAPGGGYDVLSGTSMASPFVAGICALLLNEFAGMRTWELEAFLRRHTIDVDNVPQGVSGNHDGYGMISFGSLQDWSNGTLAAASSANTSYERLGAEVTGESSMTDAGAVGADDGDDEMPDLDGVTNASGHDGGDDGLFPASFSKLPLLPPHIDTAAPKFLDFDLTVAGHLGERYDDAGENLRLQLWVDWNSNDTFEAAGERLLNVTSSPSAWAADTKRESFMRGGREDHYKGNPLRFRTRLDWAAGGALPGPTGAQAWGEVEDHDVVNFVEDFDIGLHSSGVLYATLEASGPFPSGGGWVHALDAPGTGYPVNHGMWHYARTDDICQPGAMVDKKLTVPDFAIDLRERTKARARMHVIHGICAAGCPGTDACYLAIESGSTATGPFTETSLVVFGATDFCAPPGGAYYVADLDIDIGAYCGKFVRLVVHHKTDMIDHLIVDDVVLFAYDDRPPAAPALAGSLGANRDASSTWTHPNENVPVLAGADLLIARAEAYMLRLMSAAVPFDWAGAFQLTPRDTTGAFPVIGNAGLAASTAFQAPTTFPDLRFGLRAEDEVTNASANATLVLSVTPTFAVGVVAPAGPIPVTPGQDVTLDFIVSNNSAALDALTETISDSQAVDWVERPLRRTSVLSASTGTVVRVAAHVPFAAIAGDSDTVALLAVSLSDPTKTASASVTLDVVAPPPPPPSAGFCFCDGNPNHGPCLNDGTAGHGCANSAFSDGALLAASGTPSVAGDSALLSASNMTGATCLFFQGTAAFAPVVIDDGLGCVGGSLIRLGTKPITSNASSYPSGADPLIHVRGAIPPAGGTRYYQCFYRNSVASFCPPATSNRTNGVVLTWVP